MRTIKFLFVILLCSPSLVAQDNYYFPERNAKWLEKPSKDFKIDTDKLGEALEFARNNE